VKFLLPVISPFTTVISPFTTATLLAITRKKQKQNKN
jgi:hypothetical protein